MSGEDVYDVAQKADDDEVGECPLCLQPYTRCDCPDDAADARAATFEEKRHAAQSDR